MQSIGLEERQVSMMSNKELYFDVEVISKSKLQLFGDCQIALVRRYRGIDTLQLEQIIHEIRVNPNNEEVAINIRGVNY